MGELFGDLPEAVGPDADARPAGRARLRIPVRDEVLLQICEVDALIDEDHPARIIWAYAARVDLSDIEAAVGSRTGVAGMPQTSPHLLLALWLYATTRGVGSARYLAELCESTAAYRWLCGGVGVNHRLLSEFRNQQGERIGALLAAHVAALSACGVIDLDEIVQDGVRVRASAGAGSFRRRKTLESELIKAQALVERLSKEEPGATSKRVKAARERAARERAARVAAALEALEAAETLREKRAKTNKTQTEKQKEPRASTTDAQARVMKMADGGFRPAYNVQFASLPANGIIVAVGCEAVGSDHGLAEPTRAGLQNTYGSSPDRYLVDGGYLSEDDIEAAARAGTTIYCPPLKSKWGRDPYELRKSDAPPVTEWRKRMASAEGKAIYRRRAIGECVHAKLRAHGLDHLTVRGLAKVKTLMTWFALASNILTARRLAQA
jgi:transposase